MRPTARRFLLDLLSTLRKGTIPVGALVEAGELHGIAGNNIRVQLARLRASGHVVRDERGRYRLGAEALPTERLVASWRHPDRRTRPWGGGWIGVHQGRAGRASTAGRTKALRLLGFQQLAPGMAVRPDNLRGDVDDVRRELGQLGLPAGDLVFIVDGLDGVSTTRARRLWNTTTLRGEYARLHAEVGASARRLPGLAPEVAMVESFLLGGRVIRHLVLDPHLPAEICPARERRALVAAMREYDLLGRSAWAAFLRRYDVPYLRRPASAPMAAGWSGLP